MGLGAGEIDKTTGDIKDVVADLKAVGENGVPIDFKVDQTSMNWLGLYLVLAAIFAGASVALFNKLFAKVFP